jgi:predicted molibdopterin-dependent oxidoreductase YjgC
VLVGADPRSDFPDAGVALRGLAGARFVVAVDTHITESVRRHADVVLPAAAWSERRGTFTNIEGRITWLSQLVTAEGMAWPDWMIANELAARLGTDLGFVRQEDVWAEITRVSPLHAGVAYELIEDLKSRDGIIVPVGDEPSTKPPRTLDPMADPGIASAELHNIAPTSMLLRASAAVSMEPEPNGEVAAPLVIGGEEEGSDAGEEEPPPPQPAALGLPQVAPPEPSTTPAAGADGDGSPAALRLVTRRTLWDGGTRVQSVPALAKLHPEPCLRVHPTVLADLGNADGELVRVASSRGALLIAATGDPSLPEGTAFLPWNLPGGRAGDLVDSSSSYTEVRVTSAELPGGGPGGS